MNLFSPWQKSPYFCHNGGVVRQCLCHWFPPLSLAARMGGGGSPLPGGGGVGSGNGGGIGGDMVVVVAVALAVAVAMAVAMAVGVGVALRGRGCSHGDYGCSGNGSCGGSYGR